MSIDTVLADLKTAIAAQTAAITRNSELLERVVAGQSAAIEKIEGGKTKPAATAKAEPAPAVPTSKMQPAPAKAEPVPAPAAKAEPIPVEPDPIAGEVTNEDVKDAANTWMGGKTKDERVAASKKLMELLDFFGQTGGKITGPESNLDAEQRKQAKFFIERWAEGLEVNFSAEYDFDGSPTQGSDDSDPLG